MDQVLGGGINTAGSPLISMDKLGQMALFPSSTFCDSQGSIKFGESHIDLISVKPEHSISAILVIVFAVVEGGFH